MTQSAKSHFALTMEKREMELKDRLKQWREHLKLTQVAFSEQTGIPLRTFKGYESGSRSPGSDALAQIAETGVNINWLLTGNGDMEITSKGLSPISKNLQNHQDQIQNLLDTLAQIDDRKRGYIVQEMLNRTLDIKLMQEMEETIKHLKKS